MATPIPLNSLTFGAELRPYLEPQELAALGDFLILDAYVRPKLDEFLSGRDVVLVIELCNPATAQQRYTLTLDWSGLREALVEMVRHRAPIGPCFLVGRVVSPALGLWSICGRCAEDEVFDPLGEIRECHLPRGATPTRWQ